MATDRSLRLVEPLHKDPKPAFSVPPPGRDLLAAISDAAAACPTWRDPLTSCPVPRLLPHQDGQQYLLPTVRMALNTGHQYAIRAAINDTRAARTQLVRLASAVMRDLEATPLDATTCRLRHLDGYGDAFRDESSVRRRAREGRKLWALLGAWPWAITPNYDGDWWVDDDVVAMWHRWLDAESHPWVASPAARRAAARAGRLGKSGSTAAPQFHAVNDAGPEIQRRLLRDSRPADVCVSDQVAGIPAILGQWPTFTT